MLDFILENYYLLNLLFTVGYTSVLLIYVGHFDPENHKTAGFQRFLVGVVGWAFYDLLIWEFGQRYPAETAFAWYRYLSFLFLSFPILGGELILSLNRPVSWRDRVYLGLPYAVLYLLLILFPDQASPAVFKIQAGYPSAAAPWNICFKAYTVILIGTLLARLALSTKFEIDRTIKKEKMLLFFGGSATLAGIFLAQVVAGGPDSRLPWTANLAASATGLAAFWAIKRYGRVLSPKNLYQTILKVSPNGMVHFQSGRIHWVNESLVRMLGYKKADALRGRPAGDLLHLPEADRRALKALAKRLSEGSIANEEMALVRADGSSAYFLVNGAPLDKADPNQGSIASFTDLSSQHRAQEEMRKRARLEGVMEMSGAACHELNQPLQVIAAQLDLLEMVSTADDNMRRRLESITQEMERLIEITRKIQRITTYKTKDYVARERIVDLEGSGD